MSNAHIEISRQPTVGPLLVVLGTLVFGIFCIAPTADAAGDEEIKANRLYRKNIEGLEHPVLLHVPKNYRPDQSWPVLVYYHGTNGRPVLDLVHHYTGGKNFILIGMTYIRQGRFQYSEQNLREEIDMCHSVINKVAAQCHINRKQIYVGGFSKGGWVSAMFVDHDHRFAGGFIMGGGVYDKQLYKVKKFTKRTPVYIGVGRRDGNTVMSLNAKVHFRSLGAEVTLDIWPDIGHEWPVEKNKSASFRQWLEMISLESEPAKHRQTMQAWFQKELQKTMGIRSGIDRYLALQRLDEMPGVQFLGSASKKLIHDELQKMRKKEPVKTEWEVQQRYRNIIRYEMKNRYLETLKKSSLGYLNLSKKYPDSIYGKLAAVDYQRTQHVIRNTREKTKEKKEVGPEDPPAVKPASKKRAPVTNPRDRIRSPFAR